MSTVLSALVAVSIPGTSDCSVVTALAYVAASARPISKRLLGGLPHDISFAGGGVVLKRWLVELSDEPGGYASHASKGNTGLTPDQLL